MEITGNIVDVVKDKIYPGRVIFENGKITEIFELDQKLDNYILPGLVDAHIHIESTLLCPSRFAEAVAPHGTVAVVADPHEIANVLGKDGIEYMIKDGKSTPLKIFYTAPSCVPATAFETAGAIISAEDISALLKKPEIVALGEMMNFPGVISDDEIVMKKILAAQKAGKPIDGHCPGLSGADLQKYVAAGISTDHECAELEEARRKKDLRMKIMFRQGSAAKNLPALISLVKEGYRDGFLVTDDIHGEDLAIGHINNLLKLAVEQGVDALTAVRMATLNPVKHYHLPCGLLRPDDPADIVVVDDLRDFKVLQTYINGELAAEAGEAKFAVASKELLSSFKISTKTAGDFQVKSAKSATVRVIKVNPGQIITGSFEAKLISENGELKTDTEKDILKIAVCSRYGNNNIGLGFISGFNLKRGAIASSVAHDSHNIIAVGVDNDGIAKAINKIIELKGGIVVTNGDNIAFLELPIAGLMSVLPASEVKEKLNILDRRVEESGCRLKNPFMALSFMALLVIPELKISDQGLFDAKRFVFTDLITDNYENFTV